MFKHLEDSMKWQPLPAGSSDTNREMNEQGRFDRRGRFSLQENVSAMPGNFRVCEEICFRGYLFQNLGESLPIWMATLMTGLIFCAFHVLEIGFDVRTLSFLLFILLLHVFLVLTRLLTQSLWLAISFHTVFDWGAIMVGLGSVVSADRHFLHIARTASVMVEDLLTAFVVVLGILLLLVWAWWSKRHLSWRATLAEDGQPQATAAQLSTVEQGG